MNFLIDFIKAIIYLSFPILIFLFFNNLEHDKNYSFLFRFSLVSSTILYTLLIRDYRLSVLVNIPLLLAYLNHYKRTYLCINLLIFVYFVLGLNFPINIVFLEYLILPLFLMTTNSKLNMFVSVTSYFYSFIYFMYNDISFLSLGTVTVLLFVLAYYAFCLILKYMTITSKNKYSKLEEQYRNYLFRFIHEVKNPIAVCKGYLEMLNGKVEDDKKKKYIELISKQINESLKIMEDYLVYGRFNVVLDYMDACLLVEDVYSDFSYLNSENVNIKLDCNVDELIIMGDYTKLKQVLVNVIKNSLEAKKDEKILNINISVSTYNGNIVIKVEDDGRGIDCIDKVGNKFYSTKNNGNGLGVNFCKTIISMHKGKIRYASKKGSGTKVSIMLPLS